MSVQIEGPNEGPFRWTVVVAEDRDPDQLAPALEEALDTARGGDIQLWIRHADAQVDAIATGLGFRRYRDLWQLRCTLPNADSGLTTRGFAPNDVDELVAMNNRAFAWHPEQGGLTPSDVEKATQQAWFQADGFRLLHDDDELIGFCWTKIHTDVEPPLGEIYVIAIDPSRHGMGLGKPMTLAGLEWLADRGLSHGMLYVESDNDPANATYAAIGFSRHHTDRAYRLDRP